MNSLTVMLDFVAHRILDPLSWFMVRCFGWMVVMPIILITSTAGPGRYRDRVAARYGRWFARIAMSRLKR